MTIFLWLLFTIAACVGCAWAGTRRTRWRIERERTVAACEDPRDTQLRELLVAVKVSRENAERAKHAETATAEELAAARDRIQVLEKTATSADGDRDKLQQRLEELLGERNALEEQLVQARRECDQLRARAQELEIELNVGQRGDLLDPSQQAG